MVSSEGEEAKLLPKDYEAQTEPGLAAYSRGIYQVLNAVTCFETDPDRHALLLRGRLVKP